MRGSLIHSRLSPPKPWALVVMCSHTTTSTTHGSGVTSVFLRVVNTVCGVRRRTTSKRSTTKQKDTNTNKKPTCCCTLFACLSFWRCVITRALCTMARGIFITDTDRPLRLPSCGFKGLCNPNTPRGVVGGRGLACKGAGHHEGEPYDHNMVSDTRCAVSLLVSLSVSVSLKGDGDGGGGWGGQAARCRVKTETAVTRRTPNRNFKYHGKDANPL
jgi:hypothetical protein